MPGGSLDVATMTVLARRSQTHPLVGGWRFVPHDRSPRLLAVDLDPSAYPPAVAAARIDFRWFDGGDYSAHYIEDREDGEWQCRWDRHPKADAPREHLHPPPDAESTTASSLDVDHHLDLLFSVLDWTSDRVAGLHDDR